ncbi:MAG: peroxiredoxin [Cellvibrionaceae bacterium]|nr:peroxiredoxin [Cellvibrionaceae bacterium]
MSIKVGDKLPEATFQVKTAEGIDQVSLASLAAGKKIVIFAVPGAFTPGCSMTHLPGFVVNADKLQAAGVDSIVCVAVNDAFVMGAWGEAQNAEEIVMAADGSGKFTQAVGMELDLGEMGLGIRSKRYALIANDGVVSYLGVDAKEISASSAETVLAELA